MISINRWDRVTGRIAGNSAFQENLREEKFTSPTGNPVAMMELRWLPASGPLAGHGGADYRVREKLTNNSDKSFERLSPNKETGIETAAWRPSGHGRADYRVRENLTNNSNNPVEKVSFNKKPGIEAVAGRPSGRRHTSQPGGAHAAGAEPPRASIKKCNRTRETGYSSQVSHGVIA
jgi:hypothetical protein